MILLNCVDSLKKKVFMNINKLYKSSVCYLCGRGYPEVTLNIEGVIHHGEKFRCLDTKNCQQTVRKLNKHKISTK